MTSGCYEILNTVNGKRYIGSAMHLKARWRAHRNELKRNKHKNQILQRAWIKYGENAFKFLPILTCPPSMLLFYEQQPLDKLQPEYNILLVAGSSLGYKHSLEARAKIAEDGRNRKRGPLSIEHRAAISAGNVGQKQKPCSIETRARIGEASRNRKHPPCSPATRKKISKALTGKPFSPERCAALSIAQFARQARIRESRGRPS